ncbi:hypothetical protein A3K29_04240 [Candidatus Collierbacteria bacterium RIFOXYB2_FULL_46_14]|uniref:phenylalanine--tRNA ligase n=1 Tax=Candidatus Collierbacteria bacterium GW2011_GWA2_46_26 TaxID=1618381 RepID=A0A0G1RU44_9BACT|nr:MAG: Phenylalanine-tRNA ligase beta subunit [Candidatus Collierbacteria bacterium GW2011_GWC2_44_13]KKU33508.1 MAG: Phenylalanine-tRNA ligase beta subunit [Candidatus Collierbacteria bacterium GW2011_GWA2_46_26]OGD73310.1 MAG: hypothetical protein A3K29_04240 [Candidatus Collierbacteria bacterium RIFOXYB2_FULL_46_14]OGD76352.1 MAG: hypothetical protein A3K43_04240 [Candidatus Collierbacteria bacterium RIFOXYA2_FULL_46_20]OGD77688.1 MAG: hypothetical protein A3K39_04240 [Candidatus Collierbac
MDIVLTDSSIRKFLDTSANSDVLSQNVSLCGPTFDRTKQIGDDYVYDIEAITNRIDTASAMGVAREAAAILTQFNIPAKFINDIYQEKPVFRPGLPKQFHFNIEKSLVLRFSAIAIENISIKPSPKDVALFLENCGLRPVNNCVDITNELTLLYGMPSHIFDLDKLAVQNLTIRPSVEGEWITTLDDEKHRLVAGDIVIEDGSGRLVDLCGIMGGQVAEVDEHTKNILLIVPAYEPKKIRQTSLRLQKRTVAAQLYEKQPDPELCLPVLYKAVQLIKERAGGEISSPLFDHYPLNLPAKLVPLEFEWLNNFIGIEINPETVVSILASLGFGGTLDSHQITCTVPSWRYPDINIKEDLAEEVARIYGYFRLPSNLPCVNLPSEDGDPILNAERTLKRYLSDIGYHEIYNSSLVSLELLEKTGLNPENHLKLNNALSQDYEYLRTSLVPSGLMNHKHNQGKIDEPLKTFEIANCYLKNNDQELPFEVSTLTTISNENFRKVKGEVEALLMKVRVPDISFKQVKRVNTFFRAGSEIFSGKQLLGHLGLVKPTILRSIDLQTEPVVTEINLSHLAGQMSTGYNYQPISEYPYIVENITVSSHQPLGDIIHTINSASTLIKEIQYLESYHDRHTFKVSFGSDARNLQQSEINVIKDTILKCLSA